MKIDLSSKKVGDTVFTALDGKCKVIEINSSHQYSVMTETKSNYMFDGRYFDGDRHPTCFNSREEFDAYWAQVKE
jgi:hypothetical protein